MRLVVGFNVGGHGLVVFFFFFLDHPLQNSPSTSTSSFFCVWSPLDSSPCPSILAALSPIPFPQVLVHAVDCSPPDGPSPPQDRPVVPTPLDELTCWYQSCPRHWTDENADTSTVPATGRMNTLVPVRPWLRTNGQSHQAPRRNQEPESQHARPRSRRTYEPTSNIER